MKFFLELPYLPKPPSNLLTFKGSPLYTQQLGRRSYSKNGKWIKTSQYDYYHNQRLYDWISENVIPLGGNIKPSIHDTYGSSINGPHTDPERPIALNYYFSLGGRNVQTVWWQEKNKPVLRDSATYPIRYLELVELEKTVCKANMWYILNTQVVHSVENIVKNRSYVSISLYKTDRDLIENKLGQKVFDWFDNCNK